MDDVPDGDGLPANWVRMRVRTNQTDLNAAMYHGAYFDCVEVFRRLGYTYARTLNEGFVPVVRHAACEYYHPASMDEEIEVRVYIGDMTAATLLVHYPTYLGSQLIAMGEVRFVFLNRQGRPIRVPASLRACIERYSEILTLPTGQ
jgi:acyl-CoA thioester hydrolase